MFSSRQGIRLLCAAHSSKKSGCSYSNSVALREDLKKVRAAKTNKSPNEHDTGHLGMWYTMDGQVAKRLFQHIPVNPFRELCQVLEETSFLIREPALELTNYISRSNFDHIPNKFILYGSQGNGKCSVIAYALQYFHDNDFIIAHLHAPVKYVSRNREILPSQTHPDWYDHTIDASKYLKHFLSQNAKTLETCNLRTSKLYQWNVREATPEGAPLTDLADFGIQRSKFASDVVFALNQELKLSANQGRCKVAVVIYGVNAIFHPVSQLLRDDRSVISPDKFTFFQAFRLFFEPNWKNGCIVGSVNREMSTMDRRKSIYPRYLLRREGWEVLDPFVPIHVSAFNEHEIDNTINFFAEKNWLQNPNSISPEGRDEIKYVSGGNGKQLLSMMLKH